MCAESLEAAIPSALLSSGDLGQNKFAPQNPSHVLPFLSIIINDTLMGFQLILCQ